MTKVNTDCQKKNESFFALTVSANNISMFIFYFDLEKFFQLKYTALILHPCVLDNACLLDF